MGDLGPGRVLQQRTQFLNPFEPDAASFGTPGMPARFDDDGMVVDQWLGSNSYFGSNSGLGSFGSLTIMSDLVSLGSGVWMIILIATAGTHPARRGLHDRFCGSIVLAPVQAAPAWPGYPYQP